VLFTALYMTVYSHARVFVTCCSHHGLVKEKYVCLFYFFLHFFCILILKMFRFEICSNLNLLTFEICSKYKRFKFENCLDLKIV
jgi:hypothetical protein